MKMKTKERIINFIISVIKKATDAKTSLFPTSLAFYAILSLIPVLTILAMFVDQVEVLKIIVSQLPKELEQFFLNQITEIHSSSTVALSTTTIIAFYVGSHGIYALIRVINQMYGFKPKGMIWNRTKAILVMLLLVLSAFFLIAGFGLIPIGIRHFGLLDISDLFAMFTAPMIALLLFIILFVIFWIAPNQKVPVRLVLPGAIIAAIAIVIGTFGFTIYVTRFADYTNLYGSLSNMIMLVLLIYVISYIIYYSICINVVLYDINRLKNIKERIRN